MTTALEILGALRRANVTVTVREGRLRLEGGVPDEIVEQVRAEKASLLALLLNPVPPMTHWWAIAEHDPDKGAFGLLGVEAGKLMRLAQRFDRQPGDDSRSVYYAVALPVLHERGLLPTQAMIAATQEAWNAIANATKANKAA